MKGLSGKVAIVTGGAASIGKAITVAFHEAGVRVVIASRSPEAGTALQAQLGDAALFHRTDITSDDDLDRLLMVTKERFGRLDFVINNACSYEDHGQLSTRREWLETLNVNLVSGAILVEKARPLLAANEGAVVNVSSISAYAAQTGRWTYPVSKAAIVHLTRLQAMDYAKDGIRVNSIIAGWTVSDPIHALSNGDQARADRVAADFHLLGRLARAEEVADGVLFMCSDHASFSTGGELRVEGGYLAMGPEQAAPAIERLGANASRPVT
jgi:NAD(P)-dependent dehydrogenase (short-subunit alcohol dehydrogenase family)